VKIDAALVSKVARLASLEISPAETEELSGQLTRIVEHFEELRAIPDSELENAPDRQATPLRLDRLGAGRDLAFAEANAPEFAHGHFVVPRVVSRND
jgi:aspartyl/glutamyl-tRNA(Asn/Gln) amidotransferase C subunit